METINIHVYTREPIEGRYNSSIGNSIHFAWAQDGNSFVPLNQNYGIVYPSAEIGDDNTIVEKGAVKPYIFQFPSGDFGIVAIRVNIHGTPDPGNIIFWYSADLIHFSEQVFCLGDSTISNLEATVKDEKTVLVRWRDGHDQTFVATLDIEHSTILECEESEPFILDRTVTHVEGSIAGNVISVNKERVQPFIQAWSPVESIAVNVPESITVNNVEDLQKVNVMTVYSDGSTHNKPVVWDIDSIDFTISGEYEINGIVKRDIYPFPLATGYADPVILPWEGKYYFIATNDNTDAVGLFVREADSITGLFDPGIKESMILGYDEEKGLIQTFWAPEFHLIGGDLYILFAVGGKEWGPQSHMMKLRRGGSIINPDDWEDPVRVVKKDGEPLTSEGITLDMTYFTVSDISYLVWSYRLLKPVDTGSMLYIATIDPEMPWRLTSNPVLLSRPLYGWENNDGTINNEGPYPLIPNDTVYLTYSGGAAGGYTYAIGCLEANVSVDLLNPENWEKRCAPLLMDCSIKNEHGPGHNSFFTDHRGDTLIAYHAQENFVDGSPRCTGIRRVHFGKNGIPLLNLSTTQDLRPDLQEVKTTLIVCPKEP